MTLNRYLTLNSITPEAFAATLRTAGYKAGPGWVREIRSRRSEPSKRLAKGIVTVTGGKVTMRDLLDLRVAPAASAPEAA